MKIGVFIVQKAGLDANLYTMYDWIEVKIEHYSLTAFEI
jgi:hypothetical protein